ncbi:VOC family protein [Subsaxibacter sp. CAU 1640]|uniref:VOC family protein n=1 Tax=Subsaxibacter sp. CAU 1640 TaxID=2933271 RepID=UPI002004675A|nr:VOC family protein [Subsaxibacter sp. CAU 1640]MCK7589024.1 VOC family protein [Subsaxibacter sp. CAU 1640]
MTTQFHLALPCVNVNKTREFYSDILGAKIGRSAVKWADVNLYGNQITFTECGPFKFECKSYNFNGDILPSFHFGIILNKSDWQEVLDRLKSKKYDIVSEVKFLENKVGEHHSFFVKDPNDYTVEFKCFTNSQEIFES